MKDSAGRALDEESGRWRPVSVQVACCATAGRLPFHRAAVVIKKW